MREMEPLFHAGSRLSTSRLGSVSGFLRDLRPDAIGIYIIYRRASGLLPILGGCAGISLEVLHKGRDTSPVVRRFSGMIYFRTFSIFLIKSTLKERSEILENIERSTASCLCARV